VNGYPYPERAAPGSVICAPWLATQWPLSSALAPLAALPTAPGCARAHVRAVLIAWGMTSLAEAAELVVTELVTNAVRASARFGQSLFHPEGRTPVIRICLLADGTRLRVEVWDQAAGFPVLRQASADLEGGRGLVLVDAMTEGRWGWHSAARAQPSKCVWAEMNSPIL
jgi:anti-sigma regulatory factor (Ser/Thr protein kinase)